MGGAHSILPPSGAPAWVHCPAWVLAQLTYPDQGETEESREGEAAHEVGAALVNSGARAGMGETFKPGELASNGVVITDEMIEGGELYASDVRDAMDAHRCYAPHIEEGVHAKRIHDQSWGTPDCWLYSKADAVLYLWDYKFGHEQVDAFENWQTINYVAGIFDQLEVDGLADQYLTVVIRIVQPRAYHRDGPIREWRLKGSDLRGYFNQLRAAAEEALGASPRAVPGLHCKHCTGRHACEANQRAACGAADYARSAHFHDMPPEAVGLELAYLTEAAKVLASRITGLEEQGMGLVRAGTPVPGWFAEQGQGRERWKGPASEIATLGDLMGVDIRKPDALITPKQAIAAGLPAEVVRQYSETPKTGWRLKRDDGRRARAIFGGEK